MLVRCHSQIQARGSRQLLAFVSGLVLESEVCAPRPRSQVGSLGASASGLLLTDPGLVCSQGTAPG